MGENLLIVLSMLQISESLLNLKSFKWLLKFFFIFWHKCLPRMHLPNLHIVIHLPNLHIYINRERVSLSEIKHKIFLTKLRKKCVRKMIVLLLVIYRGMDSEYNSQSNYSICNSILCMIPLIKTRCLLCSYSN
jgi:hypothetical protein